MSAPLFKTCLKLITNKKYVSYIVIGLQKPDEPCGAEMTASMKKQMRQSLRSFLEMFLTIFR